MFCLLRRPPAWLFVLPRLSRSLAISPRGSPSPHHRRCLSPPLFFQQGSAPETCPARNPFFHPDVLPLFFFAAFSPLIPRFLFTSASPATCSPQSYVTLLTIFFFFFFFPLDCLAWIKKKNCNWIQVLLSA